MHRYLHIVTDIERLVDPDGQCFDTLASAIEEARQCGRDLMAEELRQGRPLPLNWRVQVADEEGCILATFRFADIVFGSQAPVPFMVAAASDPNLVERAKVLSSRHSGHKANCAMVCWRCVTTCASYQS